MYKLMIDIQWIVTRSWQLSDSRSSSGFSILPYSRSSINQDHPLFKIVAIIKVSLIRSSSRFKIIHTSRSSSRFKVIDTTKIILKIQVGLIMLGSWRVGWGVQSCRMRLSPMPNGSDVRVCQDIASCTCYGLW